MKLRLRILLLLLPIVFCDSSTAAVLVIESIPRGLNAWANGRYLGRTPLTATLNHGETSLRLVEPSGSLYRAPAVDTLLSLVEAETLRVRFQVGDPVSIRSKPFGLPVFRNGKLIGTTPIHLRLDPARAESLELLTSGGRISIPIDSLSLRRDWVWKGELLSIPSSPPSERRSLRGIGRYVMPALAVAMAAGGLVLENESDRAYSRYLRTADPAEITKHYDEAKRRDGWATTLWVGAEVSLATAVIAWILPEGGSSADTETER